MDLLAFDLWDMVIAVLRSTNSTPRHEKLAQGETEFEQLSNVDFVPTKPHSSQEESQLYIFEYNEAVIKMIFRGDPEEPGSSGSSEPTPEEPLRWRGAQGGSWSNPPKWIPNRGVQG